MLTTKIDAQKKLYQYGVKQNSNVQDTFNTHIKRQLESIRENIPSGQIDKYDKALLSLEKKVDRMGACSRVLIQNTLHFTKKDRHKLLWATCKTRSCLICWHKKMLKRQMHYYPLLKEMQGKKKNLYYLVFTVRHDKYMTQKQVLDKCIDYKNRLQSEIRKHKKGVNSYIGSVISGYNVLDKKDEQGGWMRKIEYTKTKNGYNYHINYLVATNDTIEANREIWGSWNSKARGNHELSKAYHELTGDSMQVSVSKVSDSMGGVKEVLGYIHKAYKRIQENTHLDHHGQKDLLQNELHTHHVGLCGVYGVFRGHKNQASSTEKNEIEQLVQEYGALLGSTNKLLAIDKTGHYVTRKQLSHNSPEEIHKTQKQAMKNLQVYGAFKTDAKKQKKVLIKQIA